MGAPGCREGRLCAMAALTCSVGSPYFFDSHSFANLLASHSFANLLAFKI